MGRPRKFEREELVEKALDLFWEEGYAGTSAQELGERLEVHPGTLFGTFGDKRSLFEEALARYQERVGGQMFGLLEQALPIREKLTTLYAEMIERLLESRASGRHGCFMVNSLMERCSQESAMDQRAQRVLGRLESELLRSLTAAVANGEIRARPDADLRAIARALMANIVSIRALARIGADRDVLQDVARVAVGLLDT